VSPFEPLAICAVSYAGANAVRYLAKQAREQTGDSRAVPVHQYGETPWFSVSCGALSVHCVGREVREELELEKLGPGPSSVTWWRQGEKRLTLDTITAEDSDCEEGDNQTSSAKHPHDNTWDLGAQDSKRRDSKRRDSSGGGKHVMVQGSVRPEGAGAEMPEAARAVGLEVPAECEEPWVVDMGHIDRASTAAGKSESERKAPRQVEL
jgi:hypothetical protein